MHTITIAKSGNYCHIKTTLFTIHCKSGENRSCSLFNISTPLELNIIVIITL